VIKPVTAQARTIENVRGLTRSETDLLCIGGFGFDKIQREFGKSGRVLQAGK
jgi:hypothetical protein